METKRLRNLSLIVCTELYGGIGRDGIIPWYCSEDLKRFKAYTTERVNMIVGPKTYLSLPEKMLEDKSRRIYIVVSDVNDSPSRAEAFKTIVDKATQHGHVLVTFEQMLSLIQDNTDSLYTVIGGAKIYDAFLPYVGEINATDFDIKIDCDIDFDFEVHDFYLNSMKSFPVEVKYTGLDTQTETVKSCEAITQIWVAEDFKDE